MYPNEAEIIMLIFLFLMMYVGFKAAVFERKQKEISLAIHVAYSYDKVAFQEGLRLRSDFAINMLRTYHYSLRVWKFVLEELPDKHAPALVEKLITNDDIFYTNSLLYTRSFIDVLRSLLRNVRRTSLLDSKHLTPEKPLLDCLILDNSEGFTLLAPFFRKLTKYELSTVTTIFTLETKHNNNAAEAELLNLIQSSFRSETETLDWLLAKKVFVSKYEETLFHRYIKLIQDKFYQHSMGALKEADDLSFDMKALISSKVARLDPNSDYAHTLSRPHKLRERQSGGGSPALNTLYTLYQSKTPGEWKRNFSLDTAFEIFNPFYTMSLLYTPTWVSALKWVAPKVWNSEYRGLVCDLRQKHPEQPLLKAVDTGNFEGFQILVPFFSRLPKARLPTVVERTIDAIKFFQPGPEDFRSVVLALYQLLQFQFGSDVSAHREFFKKHLEAHGGKTAVHQFTHAKPALQADLRVQAAYLLKDTE